MHTGCLTQHGAYIKHSILNVIRYFENQYSNSSFAFFGGGYRTKSKYGGSMLVFNEHLSSFNPHNHPMRQCYFPCSKNEAMESQQSWVKCPRSHRKESMLNTHICCILLALLLPLQHAQLLYSCCSNFRYLHIPWIPLLFPKSWLICSVWTHLSLHLVPLKSYLFRSCSNATSSH